MSRSSDTCSYRAVDVVCQHVGLALTVDFERQVLRGSATLTCNTAPTSTFAVFDTRGLNILGCTDAESGEVLTWDLGV